MEVISPMFIHDSAPAHESKTVQAFLKKELPRFVGSNVWLSSSPDLNHCHNLLWRNVEKVSNARPPTMKCETSVRRAFRTIKKESAIKACQIKYERKKSKLFIFKPISGQSSYSFHQPISGQSSYSFCLRRLTMAPV